MPFFVGHRWARALFVGTLLLWVLGEGRQELRRRSEATNEDRGSRLVIGVSWAAAIVAAALARSRAAGAAFPGDAITFGVGLAFSWAGIGLRLWSEATLGRYFTFSVMTSADQPVITTGPYGFVRHPSYLGLLLIFTGIGLMFANWLSLAALVLIPLAGLIYRIRVEEAALSQALGEIYTDYAARRKRLIPMLW
jgi:protein-S-isoprenylcysteine O-methyltransferase Ste14